MAALYHGLKRVVHLAYLTYQMYGRKLSACKILLKIKIVYKRCRGRHGQRKALAPPMLVGTHFKASEHSPLC